MVAAKEELEARYREGNTIAAREVTSGPIETAAENDLVVDIVQRMLRGERSCLPVARDGVLVGMVTRRGGWSALRLVETTGSTRSLARPPTTVGESWIP
jgi:predicted transcriptional regulator